MTQNQKWPKIKNNPKSKMTQNQKWPQNQKRPKIKNDPKSKMTEIKKWPIFKNDPVGAMLVYHLSKKASFWIKRFLYRQAPA